MFPLLFVDLSTLSMLWFPIKLFKLLLYFTKNSIDQSSSNILLLESKLPISSNGRSCTDEYGCDELTNGDTIYVEGYNDMFKVTVYDNKYFQYIPFL